MDDGLRFQLIRGAVAGLAEMLGRVDDGSASKEDLDILEEFQELVRALAAQADDPRIKTTIMDMAWAEMERQGGERIQPDLRVVRDDETASHEDG